MRPAKQLAASCPANTAFRDKEHAKRAARRRRYALPALLLCAVVSAAAALPGSHIATAKKLVPSTELVPSRALAPTALASIPSARTNRTMLSSPFFFFQAAPPPLQTFAADCTTPKTDWSLGETVCVTASAPTGASPLYRVELVNPAGFIVGGFDVTSNPQTVTFDLTTETSFTLGNRTFDNRGTWHVNLSDTLEANVRAFASITVHDPQETVANLQINKVVANSLQATAGTDIEARIRVFNAGPDGATNVKFIDVPPSNTTFQSLTQTAGPTFTCTTPAVNTTGSSECTTASFANGETADFVATYRVNANVANAADLSTSASVESDTTETEPGDNGATEDLTSDNPTPPNCTLACPANITVDSDPGLAGANIDYPDTTASSGCGGLTTDHPEDPQTGTAFFPIGNTTVTITAGDGSSCSFVVTVIDKRAVSITINGSAEMTVNCGTSFTDPGATATDGTNSLPVTTTVSVPDPSGAVDQNGDAVMVPVAGVDTNAPGDYTITYTATKDGNTVTATRIVHVVASAPPVITLANTAGFTPQTVQITDTDDNGNPIIVTETILVKTIECHSSFSPPTATAVSGCGNTPIPVTTTGAVDANTPGTYEIIYSAVDNAGNDAETRVRVTVVDTTGPAITLNGASPMTVECHTSFTDPGATAADACEGPVSVSASGSVNPDVPGTYTITYTATDSGNRTTTVTRTVNVVDTTPPTISCQANILVDFNPAVGGAVVTYSTPVGTDSCGAPTTTQTTGLPSGSTFPPGTTTNTFTVTDPSGNTASCSFKVTVALTSIIGLDSVSLSGAVPVDSYDSNGGYPATKGSLASIVSNGTITMTGSSKVSGSVRSTRAGVVMSGASQVTGNATAGTTVSRSGSASVGGTITNNALAPVIALPSVASCGAPYSSNSGISGSYSYNAGTGDLNLTGVNIATLANGTYCFHNLSIGNSAQLKVNGPVTIKLTGTLSTSGASQINNTTLIPGNLRILSSYSGSNGVSFGNSTNAYLVIYAPRTGVTISGAVPVFGNVTGKTITISNSGTVHYDTRLQALWPDIWQTITGP
jgi:uncharacterized repeat protein (TIGR01451 family)